MTSSLRQVIRSLISSGMAQEALLHCNSYFEANADLNDDLFSCRADVRWVCGERLLAISDMEIAHKLRPTSRAHLYQLAHWQVDVGDYQKALECAEKLRELELSKNSKRFIDAALFIKGYSLIRLGKIDEGKKILKLVADEQPIWIEGRLVSKNELMLR
jgi:tetratricopeptide (TPR) repeat protein